jgi:hypothetical protein
VIVPSDGPQQVVALRVHVVARTWTWLGSGMCASNTSRASGISAGCATQVPSWPAVTSRSLSARTRASAASLAASSPLDRDLRGHAAHRVRAAAVAGLDQQLGVGAQERLHHRHLAALGQHPVAVPAKVLM